MVKRFTLPIHVCFIFELTYGKNWKWKSSAGIASCLIVSIPWQYFYSLLGLWPTERTAENPLYYFYNVLIMILFSFFMTTIVCDLYEASSDFVLLGEDLVVVLGVSTYIHTYVIYCYLFTDVVCTMININTF